MTRFVRNFFQAAGEKRKKSPLLPLQEPWVMPPPHKNELPKSRSSFLEVSRRSVLRGPKKCVQDCNMKVWITIILLCMLQTCLSDNQFYYLKQCYKPDPNVNECLQRSANYLVKFMKDGIPELGLHEPEPIIIDEIGIALGSGPDGYRASFQNIQAYGVSNLTVTAVRSDIDTHQFQFTFYIPHISAKAQYESTGVLILVPASGGGEYWGEYDGVKAKVYIKAKPMQYAGRTFLTLEQLKMDFSVKEIRMGVENVHNGNSVIQAALNLFINSNSQELLKEMKPDLKKKLMQIMSNFVETLFNNIPYDAWIKE